MWRDLMGEKNRVSGFVCLRILILQQSFKANQTALWAVYRGGVQNAKSLHPSQKKQFDFCRVAFLLYRICGEI